MAPERTVKSLVRCSWCGNTTVNTGTKTPKITCIYNKIGIGKSRHAGATEVLQWYRGSFQQSWTRCFTASHLLWNVDKMGKGVGDKSSSTVKCSSAQDRRSEDIPPEVPPQHWFHWRLEVTFYWQHSRLTFTFIRSCHLNTFTLSLRTGRCCTKRLYGGENPEQAAVFSLGKTETIRFIWQQCWG